MSTFFFNLYNQLDAIAARETETEATYGSDDLRGQNSREDIYDCAYYNYNEDIVSIHYLFCFNSKFNLMSALFPLLELSLDPIQASRPKTKWSRAHFIFRSLKQKVLCLRDQFQKQLEATLIIFGSFCRAVFACFNRTLVNPIANYE